MDTICCLGKSTKNLCDLPLFANEFGFVDIVLLPTTCFEWYMVNHCKPVLCHQFCCWCLISNRRHHSCNFFRRWHVIISASCWELCWLFSPAALASPPVPSAAFLSSLPSVPSAPFLPFLSSASPPSASSPSASSSLSPPGFCSGMPWLSWWKVCAWILLLFRVNFQY